MEDLDQLLLKGQELTEEGACGESMKDDEEEEEEDVVGKIKKVLEALQGVSDDEVTEVVKGSDGGEIFGGVQWG